MTPPVWSRLRRDGSLMAIHTWPANQSRLRRATGDSLMPGKAQPAHKQVVG